MVKNKDLEQPTDPDSNKEGNLEKVGYFMEFLLALDSFPPQHIVAVFKTEIWIPSVGLCSLDPKGVE